jgi:GWxTD domain-containing protein
MRRRLAFVLAVLIPASAALAQSIPELFQKAKAQVKGAAWQDALKTLDAVETEASKPGNEEIHKKVQAPLSFYRGVCEANLGQVDKARVSFTAFLAIEPNSSMDPAMYSKSAVAAFEDARKASAAAAAAAAPASSGSPSLFNSFQEFKAPPNSSDPVDEQWGSGPVQWIMTTEEKKTWAALQSGGERVEFVEKFWESRNPSPGNPDNVYKTGFERRVAFADARFVQDEKKRGSLTDRGMVFVLLGPPTYGGRRPIKYGEDSSEALGQTSVAGVNAAVAMSSAVGATQNGKVSSSQVATIGDQYSGPGTQAAQNDNNYQEVWHYRKELLPKNVGYLQVDVAFVTRKGYGVNVLQRDSQTLTTLDAAKKQPR